MTAESHGLVADAAAAAAAASDAAVGEHFIFATPAGAVSGVQRCEFLGGVGTINTPVARHLLHITEIFDADPTR